MRLLRCERATVGMAPPRMAASDELSGRRTYLSERSCAHTQLPLVWPSFNLTVVSECSNTDQEKGISEEGIDKHGPANPASRALARCENLRHPQGKDDTNKLVS